MTTLQDVSDSMRMLLDEQGVPRGVREKIQVMIRDIKESPDKSILANQLLMVLDDLQGDINIPSYVRTHLWSVSSMLENLE